MQGVVGTSQKVDDPVWKAGGPGITLQKSKLSTLYPFATIYPTYLPFAPSLAVPGWFDHKPAHVRVERRVDRGSPA